MLRAVLLLSEHELVAEARALGRILVETSIRLAWVLQRDGIHRSADDRERYAQCLVLVDEREAQKAALLAAETDAESDDPQFFEEFTKDVLEVLKDSKNDGEGVLRLVTGNRAGPKIATMAEDAGGPMHAVHYLKFYRFFCQDAHASIQSGVEARDREDSSAHDLSLSLINESVCAVLAVGAQLLGAPDLLSFVLEFRAQLDDASARRIAAQGQ